MKLVTKITLFLIFICLIGFVINLAIVMSHIFGAII